MGSPSVRPKKLVFKKIQKQTAQRPAAVAAIGKGHTSAAVEQDSVAAEPHPTGRRRFSVKGGVCRPAVAAKAAAKKVASGIALKRAKQAPAGKQDSDESTARSRVQKPIKAAAKAKAAIKHAPKAKAKAKVVKVPPRAMKTAAAAMKAAPKAAGRRSKAMKVVAKKAGKSFRAMKAKNLQKQVKRGPSPP